MTLTQLTYVVALDNHRHFSDAANACFVTQPSLSMQVQKLEDELGVIIFNRKNGVVPTAIGAQIIVQAKRILAETAGLHDIVQHFNNENAGTIKIGIIQTLAPYLLPLFLHKFIKKYPEIKITISELTTEKIIQRLKSGDLDAGLMATPLLEADMAEDVLFYEEFVAYVSPNDALYNKKYILPADIDVNKLWLLEEGHCLRSQVINLCALQKSAAHEKHFDYETGSIETLKRFVEQNQGITLLPELATLDLSRNKKAMLRYFKAPAPVREVSIVSIHNSAKKRLIEMLKSNILENLPEQILKHKVKNIVAL